MLSFSVPKLIISSNSKSTRGKSGRQKANVDDVVRIQKREKEKKRRQRYDGDSVAKGKIENYRAENLFLNSSLFNDERRAVVVR